MGRLARGMAFLVNALPPCVVFEDNDLLVVNKPAGINSHSPSPHAGEGLYEWLRHRMPRWASLALIHRLDKETSGVMVFAKSSRANTSLSRQFSEAVIEKTYLLLTQRPLGTAELRLRTALVRSGDRYHSRPPHAGADIAETLFHPVSALSGHPCIQARPLTGKTHQIRVHAAELGFPILGDALYGGRPAPRLCLHAWRIILRHPVTDEQRCFECPPDFDSDPGLALRAALIPVAETNAYRLVHGAADAHPRWYLDRLGDVLLSQSAAPLTDAQRARVSHLMQTLPCRAGYHKTLLRKPNGPSATASAPQLVMGQSASSIIHIVENGVRFQLDLGAGYSVGLFLDQRENRRRLLANHIAAHFPVCSARDTHPQILNAFAYTAGFSVCAALAGALTTNLDLSPRYLDWAKTNFRLNDLRPEAHAFLVGDVFDGFRRLARKQRCFDAILLDPPTFSRSKHHGVFQVEKDYSRLIAAALPLLAAGGILFASANTARLPAEVFLKVLSESIAAAGRRILRWHYCAQPFDFPITRNEPAHLKTIWFQVR